MIALCVDDESLLLEDLVRMVSQSPDIDDAVAFQDGDEALEWLISHKADVAFLDIRLRAMSGLDLAECIQDLYPEMPIVFCTGYEEYALDAFRIHAAGYLTKPIQEEDLQREINHILGRKERQKVLSVTCFGEFEAYANGRHLPLKRKKTKELLAYLIDRRGSKVTAKEICAVLWPEQMDENKNMNYFFHLLSDLRSALKKEGAEDILLHQNSSYAVDMDQIECDFYRYLEGDKEAIHKFTGEYMTRYSWAEPTCAYLMFGKTSA